MYLALKTVHQILMIKIIRMHEILFVNTAGLDPIPAIQGERQGVLNAPTPDKTSKPLEDFGACDAGLGSAPYDRAISVF